MLKAKNKKNSTKNTILSIGGLSLIIGIPISLVVSCSAGDPTVVTDKVIADEINNIANIKPDSKGEFSSDFKFEGWDFNVVASDSIGKSDTPKLTDLIVGTMYRLQFILSDEYAIPKNLTAELTIDSNNDTIYYSDIYVFTDTVQSLIRTQIDALIASNIAEVSESFNGWEIDVVSSTISSNEIYEVLTNLEIGNDYKLKFSIRDNYILGEEISEEFLHLYNGNYYTTKTYTFTNFAESIQDLELNSITPTADGIINETFLGWTATIVDTIDENQIVLDALIHNTTYFFKFTLLNGFIVPSEIDELILNENDGSYYSSVKTFEVIKAADDIFELSTVMPNQIGIINQGFSGWEITVVDSIESNIVLNSLSANTSYFLKFTLLDGFSEANMLDELILNDNGSYYSAERLFTENAENVIRLESIIPTELGEITKSIVGWDITVVNIIGSNQVVLDTLVNDTEYLLKFTLQAGFLAPTELGGLEFNAEDNAYYSAERIFVVEVVAEVITGLDTLEANQQANVEEIFTGWDITVVDGITTNVELSNLELNDKYFLKFTLLTGYIAPSDLTGLSLNSNGSYYYETELTFVVESLDTVEFFDSLSVNRLGEVINDFSQETGWNIEVVLADSPYNLVGEFNEGSTDYRFKLTLKPGYIAITLPNSLQEIEFNDGSSTYYSFTRTYVLVYAEDIIGLADIEVDENGEFVESFTGWDITVVDRIISDTIITSLDPDDTYYLKFTLQDGVFAPSELGGLILNTNDSYYTSIKTFKVVAHAISGFIDELSINEFGEFINSFSDETGWSISIVNTDSPYELIEGALSQTQSIDYRFKFTLKKGYLENSDTSAIEIYDVGSEAASLSYSITYKPFSKDLNTANLRNVLPDSTGNISREVRGWNVLAVSAVGETDSLTSLEDGTKYYLKFTLQNEFVNSGTIDTLFFHENAYYSHNEITYTSLLSEDELNFDSDKISFIQASGDVYINQYREPYNTFKYLLVMPTNEELWRGIILGDSYRYKAVLNDGEKLPNDLGAFTFNRETNAYYTEVRVYEKTVNSPGINWNYRAFAFYTDDTGKERLIVPNDPTGAFIGWDIELFSQDGNTAFAFDKKINYHQHPDSTDFNQGGFIRAIRPDLKSDSFRVISINGVLRLEENVDGAWTEFIANGWYTNFVSTVNSYDGAATTNGVDGEEYYIRFNLQGFRFVSRLEEYSEEDWSMQFSDVADVEDSTTFIWKVAFTVGE